MLRRIAGRDGIETARTVVAVASIFVALLAFVQLGQLRETDLQREQVSARAEAVAIRFAAALTTYDYAHPEVQLRTLESSASPEVVAAVEASRSDIVSASASSIGSASTDHVVQSDGQSAEVVVVTNQLVRSRYSPLTQSVKGALDIHVAGTSNSWLVVAYAWLAAPAPPTNTGISGS